MLLFILGLFIAFIYSYKILPNNEGETPLITITQYPIIYKGMIIIPYTSTYAIHIHHWIICLIIYIISMYIYMYNIIKGIIIGLFIQGILYKDRFNIICNNPY